MSKQIEKRPEENPVYHNTYKLLKNYRDARWSLEVAVQQIRCQFQLEYGEDINEFLESLYIAGADWGGTEIESRARNIERSRKMLQLIDSSVELLRKKHKFGEIYYGVLYYAFLSPQQLEDVESILEKLQPHMHNISRRTYYLRSDEAIDALGAVFGGYTSRDCLDVLEKFFPAE